MPCPACGARSAPSAQFCARCGSRLPPSESKGRRRKRLDHEFRGDRRVVTALFADLVDYVKMLAELDAEEVKRRVDAALAAMDASVVRFGGAREKFIGDAIFAVFGYPQAHDDDSLRAGLCALAIRGAMIELAGPDEEPLAVRIGIATGEVVAAPRNVPGPSEVSLTGPAVVIAARMQGLAGPGEILIDETTLRASRGRLVADSRGTRTLRGHPGEIPVYALRADIGLHHAAPQAGRLIGREHERARLRALIDATHSTGIGRAAVVIGDAGIGKSRLLADLETDARRAGFRWTVVENVSYGTSEPYRFARAFAQAIADEQGTDSGTYARQLLFTDDVPPDQARRLAGAIAAIAREAAFSGWEEEAPLAPTKPAEVRAGVLETSLRYTRRLAEKLGPRIVVIDDLHWADHSSLPIIELLVQTAPSVPFVLLLGTRSVALPSWLDRDEVDRIVLAGLDREEVGALAATVTGASLTDEDARVVHERTAGNPLFVNETIRAMLEDGRLEVQDGQARLHSDRGYGPLPVTLRALLGARIDALPEAAREVLRVASVIGVTFERSVVEKLIGRRIRVPVVKRLLDSALIVGTDDPDTWRFAHDLIRDVAYAGLLTSLRRSHHSRLADIYERTPPAGIGRAAVHRAHAGDAERALPMLEESAQRALAVGASAEAAGFWRMAADLVGDADPRRDVYRANAASVVDAGKGGSAGQAAAVRTGA
jgi:adenylate cyclase